MYYASPGVVVPERLGVAKGLEHQVAPQQALLNQVAVLLLLLAHNKTQEHKPIVYYSFIR